MWATSSRSRRGPARGHGASACPVSRSSPRQTRCSSRSTHRSDRRRPSRRPTPRSCRWRRSPVRSRRSCPRSRPRPSGRRPCPARRAACSGRCTPRSIRPPLATRPDRPTRARCRSSTSVERSLPGQVQFVDNLSDQLNTAAGDALYADTLYIMLALPGALVGLALAYLAALGTVERDAHELALLRVRGARGRDLLALASDRKRCTRCDRVAVSAARIALLAVKLLVGGGVTLTVGRAVIAGVVCIGLAMAGAMVARLAATATVRRATISAAHRGIAPRGRPLWQRLYLDLVALALSGLIYWLTASTGFSAVINPDSNPTLSLSVYMFFGPALLWIGATLLLVRLRGRALAWTSRRIAGPRHELARVSARQRRPARCGDQPRADRARAAARLRGQPRDLHGHLRPAGERRRAADARRRRRRHRAAGRRDPAQPRRPDRRGRRVSRRRPRVDHSYAYVGPDLQDTYGIDPATFTQGHESARLLLPRRRRRGHHGPPALPARRDPRLQGDDQRLLAEPRRPRCACASSTTAPANSTSSRSTSSASSRSSPPHPGLVHGRQPVLSARPPITRAVRTSCSPRPATPPPPRARVAAATRTDGTLVKNITQQAQQTVSSITTVDLRGIAKILEVFT